MSRDCDMPDGMTPGIPDPVSPGRKKNTIMKIFYM
jgi:hypothetical protein